MPHPLKPQNGHIQTPPPWGTPTCTERFPNLLVHTIMDERVGMIYASKNFLLGVLVEHEQKYTEPLS